MDDRDSVSCPHCQSKQEINEFFVNVGQAFGLVGILCSECGETIPGEQLEAAVLDESA